MQHTHYFACKDPPIINNNPNNSEFNDGKEKKSIKNLFGLIKNKSDAKEESKMSLEDRISNLWSDYSSKPESINVKKAFKLMKKASNGAKLDKSLTKNMI
jgi:capsid protein